MGSLQRLRKNHIVKRAIRVKLQIGVGISLYNRKTPAYSLVHSALRKFNTASVTPACFRKQGQQRAVAATDVKHPRAGFHHFCNREKINAGRIPCRQMLTHDCGPSMTLVEAVLLAIMPLFLAAASRKPRVVPIKSGSSSKKASWPLSDSISTNDTDAPAALSA